MAQDRVTEAELAALIRRGEEANAAFVRGDMQRFVTLMPHSEDYTLMAPFGGAPARGFDASPERLADLARYFSCGAFASELVQAYVSGDMVVLATIERQHGAVGGLPPQDWALRVTEVYRREGAGWLLAHRHADPLVNGITLEQAAALARG